MVNITITPAMVKHIERVRKLLEYANNDKDSYIQFQYYNDMPIVKGSIFPVEDKKSIVIPEEDDLRDLEL